MKTPTWPQYFFLAVALFMGAPPGNVQARDGDEEDLAKKLVDVRIHLDDLRRIENDLSRKHEALVEKRKVQEDWERRHKEQAERKKRFPKIELRGILECQTITATVYPPVTSNIWSITVNDQNYLLLFADKKEPANEMPGTELVITGKLEVGSWTERIIVRPVDPPGPVLPILPRSYPAKVKAEGQSIPIPKPPIQAPVVVPNAKIELPTSRVRPALPIIPPPPVPSLEPYPLDRVHITMTIHVESFRQAKD